jgi:hypothetical protein
VLRADGREQRGRGAASASVAADLHALNGTTKVAFTTDLTITGAAAQYGRGMIQDISSRLTGQFASCLQTNMAAERGGPAAAGRSGEAPATPDGSVAAPAAEAPAPAAPGPASRAPASAAPVRGIRLGMWAMWRAVVRFFNRLFGRRAA